MRRLVWSVLSRRLYAIVGAGYIRMLQDECENTALLVFAMAVAAGQRADDDDTRRWLRGVAKRVALRAVRTEVRKHAGRAFVPVDDVEHVLADLRWVPADEPRDHARVALNALEAPTDWQRVLLEERARGTPYKVIAARVGRSPEALRVAFLRLTRRVARKLAP